MENAKQFIFVLKNGDASQILPDGKFKEHKVNS